MLKNYLYSLLVFYVLSLIIFIPITGMVLNDYNLNINLLIPFGLAIFFTSLKFLWLTTGNIQQQVKKSYSRFYEKIRSNFTELLNQNSSQVFCDKCKIKQLLEYKMVLLFSFALLLPFIITKYWLSALILSLIYILLGLGLNIVVGFAGLLDLGYVAFYAVGAYTYALGAEYLHLSFWLALPLGALLAGLLGTLLAFPVLRMHGDYLAIVTLGFGEIIRLILVNWDSFTHGSSGVIVPKFSLFGMEFGAKASNGNITWHEFLGVAYHSKLKYIIIYLILLLVVVMVVALAKKLKTMPIGRAWEALRENEIAVRSLGIYHVTTKLYAFSISAAIGGLGGVFFAAYQGFVNPTSFTFIESALILAIVVLGGMGSITGVIFAALFLTLIPELFREFVQFRMFLFGLLMIVIMHWCPRGFVSVKRPVFKI